MDQDVINEKIESLRRYLQRIHDKCPDTAAALSRNLDAQDIVSLNLTRAVQICVDLATHVIASREMRAPDTMGQAFDALADAALIPSELAGRLKKSVGFRNLAVHNYDAIDWAIVFEICTKHLDDFRAYASCILEIAPQADSSGSDAPAT